MKSLQVLQAADRICFQGQTAKLRYELHNSQLAKTVFCGDFPLLILRLFGLMGRGYEVGSSRKRMAVNTALKVKNAADIFYFLFFCSSRISHRVIQCDGFFEWQNAP